MLFCPTCANILFVETVGGSTLRFFCQTCPYIYNVVDKVVKKVPLKRKKVDDVLGGEEAWKNVDQTEVTCPQCSNTHAYFMQLQIRSADEPATLFFKCTNNDCQHRWREG
mmetsp:Transcript_17406/g.28596  ORF Transcript_17406/g.28596 Transcript_17406/m.28596 type:complete len:110 (-) Transcript_17406:785-1114(-)